MKRKKIFLQSKTTLMLNKKTNFFFIKMFKLNKKKKSFRKIIRKFYFKYSSEFINNKLTLLTTKFFFNFFNYFYKNKMILKNHFYKNKFLKLFYFYSYYALLSTNTIKLNNFFKNEILFSFLVKWIFIKESNLINFNENYFILEEGKKVFFFYLFFIKSL